MKPHDISPDAMIPLFETAAGKAAVVELKLRILAEIIPALAQYAHGDKLHEVEMKIFDWFASIGDAVSATDQATITNTRRFRNKLLHGELHTARTHMQALGAPPQTGGVMHMKFDGSAGSMLTQIAAALTNKTMKPVAGMTTAEAGIGGWLLEMGVAGDFENASDACAKASALIDSLIDRAHEYFLQTKP